MNAKRTRNYYDMFAIMFNNSEILPKIYRKYPFGPLNGNTRVLPGNIGEEYFNQVCGSLLNFKKSS